MRFGPIGGLLVIAACLLLLATEAIAATGESVRVATTTPGGIVATSALILLAVGAAILGLSGGRPLDGGFVRGGLLLVAIGILTVIATSNVSASSLLVVVYLAGGLVNLIGAVTLGLALLRSSRRPRRLAYVFLAGLLLAAIGGGAANAASSDVALVAGFAKVVSPVLALIGSWVMLAAVTGLGFLGLRATNGDPAAS